MNEIVHTQDFVQVLTYIQQARQKAYAQVNTTLIELYWHIGGIISQKVGEQAWGKSVVSELAQFIAHNDPTAKGFSDKNLWRMKQFYETYQGDEKLSPLVRELPWTHNTIIFSRCKTAEERVFYLYLTITDRYSKRELERQIDASLFERTASLTLSPTLIAQYQTQLPDKKLIQAKLHEFYALSMEAQEIQS